jgi:NitT/TauT family transport system substrate-binding protein
MTLSRRRFVGGLLSLPVAGWCRGSGAQGVAPTSIRLNIPGPGALPFAPLEMIPKLGIDRSLGAELQIRYFPSGVYGLEDMLAGNADFAGVGFSVLCEMLAKGQDVVAIAPFGGGMTPSFAIVVHQSLRGTVRSIADLRGRSVGVSIGGAKSKAYLQVLAELLLKSHGVQPDQVRWVGTAQNIEGQVGALVGKVVDAVFCEEPFPSGLVRRKVGFVLADLRDPKTGSKVLGAGHVRAAIATTNALTRQDPARAQLMVEMLRRAVDWMHNHKPEAIIARLEIADAQERRDRSVALARSPEMFPPDVRFSRSQVEAMREFLRAGGDRAAAAFDAQRLINDTWAGSRP